MKTRRPAFRFALSIVAVVLLISASALAAVPPTLVNYQGVLRDAADKPRNGTFDMVFRFFDAATAGTEILVDSHTGGGGNAVTVSGGLFSTALGGGTVTDGSGAGTYTNLADVFRDYGTVYLQITIGGETLSPRIRVQSGAYALNASNLGGKPSSSFVDTSSTSQTKAGHLIASDGLEGNSTTAVGVQGIGLTSGGTFADSSITAVAHLGYATGGNKYGVHGMGATAGGWFHNPAATWNAYLGYAGYGVYANGTQAGGYFYDASGNYGYVGYSFGYGLYGNGTNTGVIGTSPSVGGYFVSGTSYAYLARTSGGYGIDAHGSVVGGTFTNGAGTGGSQLSSVDVGVWGWGNYRGGSFYDTDNSGSASVGFGDLGISASGLQAGGYFSKPGTSAQAYLAASNGAYENGVYGLSSGSNASPGYFVDQYSGTYSYVGTGSKIAGNGGVFFVQNDPTDSKRIIQYAAPEGDEVAVYTRGTARLSNGAARVRLGETFASVANPDVGLTVQVTPRGAAVPLAVESVSTTELTVRGPAGGPTDVVFDYAVWGLRIGFEDHAVLRPKKQEAFIPSPEANDAIYTADPPLRAYNAHERFRRMESDVSPAALRSESGADALKAAIHVYDRTADTSRMLVGQTPPPDVTLQRPSAASVPSAPQPLRLAVPGASAGSAATPGKTTASLPVRGPAPAESSVPLATVFPANTVPMPVTETVEAGDVLANDPVHPASLRRASLAADPAVVGIAAGDSGAVWNGTAPIALAGTVVRCRTDASQGAIRPNDLLVASSVSGSAARAGENPAQGTVIGKALEGLDSGSGLIRVLVMPH